MTADRNFPQSPEAEAGALGAALQDSTAADALVRDLRASDFFLMKHAQIYAAIESVKARAGQVDPLTVAQALTDRGQLQEIGTAYLADLVDGVQVPSHHPEYIRTVKHKSASRRVIDHLTRAAERVRGNGVDPAGVVADLWENLRDVEAGRTIPLPVLDPPVAVLRESQNQGDPIPTGIPVLDARLRGGLRQGKALVIGGTPFAGKTALGIQIVRAAVESGCVAACLMADEGREAASVRLGQQLGYARADLEGGHGPTLNAMERDLAGRAILFPDPDGEGDITLEGVAEALVAAYPDRRKLLLVDSVQTVRTRRPEGDQPSLRERVMENARTARRLAVEHGLVTIYTSEVHRGWYRNRKVEDRSTDLAAFAEARIEFSGDTLLLLRAHDEDPDLVEIRVPKNRLGTRHPFFLRMDQKRSLFSVVEGDPSAAMRDAAGEALVEKQTQAILQALQKEPGLTVAQLWQVVAGNRGAFLAALKQAKDCGIVIWRREGRSIRHSLAEVPK